MPAYADSVRRPPRTLTDVEQARLLKTTGEHLFVCMPRLRTTWLIRIRPQPLPHQV